MKKQLLLLMAIFLVACAPAQSGPETEPATGEKINIVATSYPVAQFVENVGKEQVNVILLNKGSADTHSYDPTPKDIKDMNDADILFYINDSMEPWIEGFKATINITVKVIDTSEGIEFLDGHDHDHEHEEDHDHEHDEPETKDPHTWTSMKNAQIMVKNIERALSELTPEQADLFKENSESYQKQLADLDEAYQKVFAEANQKKLVFLGHFAFNYLMNDYGFEYTVLYESLAHESEPTASKMKEIIDYVNQNNLKYVFKEELASDSVVKAILDTTKAEALEIHASHALSKDDQESEISYIEIQERNLENLKKGLQ